ncbi:MAG: hypothetical protein H6Q92_596 [Nitrospirae bacterium]|nr:hypothetical protein [Nitrospirota bacterium]
MIVFKDIFSYYFSVLFFQFLPAVPFFALLSRHRIASEPEYGFKGNPPFLSCLPNRFHCVYHAVLRI